MQTAPAELGFFERWLTLWVLACIGAGIGLRYLTPIGPLRLDAAIPLNPGPDDPSFSLYIGLGQSF